MAGGRRREWIGICYLPDSAAIKSKFHFNRRMLLCRFTVRVSPAWLKNIGRAIVDRALNIVSVSRRSCIKIRT